MFCKFSLSDWHDIVKQEKFADAVIIATPDRLHRVSIKPIIQGVPEKSLV